MAFIKNKKHEPVARDERNHPRDFAHLVVELSSTNPTARRWAARDLADCPEATPALMERLKQETDDSVRQVILTTLTRMGDFGAVMGLAQCLRSEDVALRNEAIEAMKQMPDEVAPLMRGLLHDPDPDVRIFAVNILESLRHPDVEAWLIDVIERDPHVNVCAAAVDLLVEVGTGAAREALGGLQLRFSAEPFVQFAVGLALRRLVVE